MKNLMFILISLFVFSSSFGQFTNLSSPLIKLKKPTDTVDFRRPDSYLLDSLVFNKIQKLRNKNKFVDLNENYRVFQVAQCINFLKIQNGIDFDKEFTIQFAWFAPKKHWNDEKIYDPILWELYGKKISKGRYVLDSTINYNKDYVCLFSELNCEVPIGQDYDYKLGFIEYILPTFSDTEKYYKQKHFNLYDIKTEVINYDKNEILTYDELSDRIIKFILSNNNMKHFIGSTMIDFECTSESNCNQFGLAIDFNHINIFITLANFNLF